MILLAALLCTSPASAAPDVVRISVAANSFAIDHPSQRNGDQISVQIRCTAGVDNPVVVSNATETELFVTSPVGLARLSPASEVGPHFATFRSLPRGTPSLEVTATHAVFQLDCAP